MLHFDIKKITNYLDKYKNRIDELYYWKSNFQSLMEIKVIDEAELTVLESSNLSNFQKHEKLKDILSKALNDCRVESKRFETIALWIIRDWGGIYGGSDLDTMKRVADFLGTDKPQFDRIASTSKVGGFMTPAKRVIYDSRVAYSLNWIILSENAGDRFFPIPEGRNSKMQAFNLNALIRLKYSDIYRIDKTEDWRNGKYISIKDREVFIPKADAYYELNRLIGQVNELLWNGPRHLEPFYTEMLLFAIADKGVFKDITERVRIEIR